MRLDSLFHVKNGIASSGLTILSKPEEGFVPFVRPASTQKRTVAGWISKSAVSAKNIYPKDSLFVSTNGVGSHSYSYVSDFEFVPNSDVSVLIPKVKMTIQEKVFYAQCIIANRYKFSYGRKPKGNRLKKIELPNKIPEWVNDVDIDVYSNLDRPASIAIDGSNSLFNSMDYKLVPLEQVFYVIYGVNLELNKMTLNKNGVNFISRTSKNNGVSSRVSILHDVEPTEAGVLTVAGGGSVLETFLQKEPFYSGRDLYYLKSKIDMTDAQKIFYCVCIRSNQYRYSYGRQANRTLKTLLIPAPTEDLLMAVEKYMNSLPYSSQVSNNQITFTGDGCE